MKNKTRTLTLSTTAFMMLFTLSGCNAQEVAQAAADAAACRAGQSVIAEVQAAYEAGMIDSGILTHLDSLLGNQVDALLSSELAGLFEELRSVVAETEPVADTAAKVEEINGEIASRCGEVGVSFSE